MTGDTTPISDEAVEAGAQAAFFTDDLGGHHKIGYQPHTWDNIPEEGRKNYRDMVRSVLVAARPLLVSAEAERRDEFPEYLIAQRDEAQAHLAEAEREIEGLRAELAEREAAITKLRATRADALADRDAITRVIMRERDRLRAELSNEVELRKSYQREVAALRTAGGQEKTDVWCSDIGSHLAATCMCPHCVMCLAPPVGGQAESSDAAKHTIAWTLDANRGCIEGRITCHAGPGDPCHRACRCEDAQ